MAVSLHLGAMLGIKPTISGAVAYLDETDVQYVSGRCLVRFDTETRQQKIVPGAVDSFGITATAVTEGKSKCVGCGGAARRRRPPQRPPSCALAGCLPTPSSWPIARPSYTSMTGPAARRSAPSRVRRCDAMRRLVARAEHLSSRADCPQAWIHGMRPSPTSPSHPTASISWRRCVCLC